MIVSPVIILLSLFGAVFGQVCKDLQTGETAKDAQLLNPCVQVVNYTYYIPRTVTDEIIESQVKTALNNALLKSLTADCQAAFVEYICTEAYVKCYDDVEIADNTTWNYGIYPTFPLPFVK